MPKGMKRYSSEQEKRVAKKVNGETQIGSGAVNVTGLKADVKNRVSEEWDLLVECKTKAVKPGQGVRSLTLHKSWIKDVQTHASDMGKSMGIVALSFDNREDFYLLGEEDFTNLYKAVIDYETLNIELNQKVDRIKKLLSTPNVTIDNIKEIFKEE